MRALLFKMIVVAAVGSNPVFTADAQEPATGATVVSAADADGNKTICAATGYYYYGSRIPEKVCHTQREWELIRRHDRPVIEEARRTLSSLP